jgi:hypothetical protein
MNNKIGCPEKWMFARKPTALYVHKREDRLGIRAGLVLDKARVEVVSVQDLAGWAQGVLELAKGHGQQEGDNHPEQANPPESVLPEQGSLPADLDKVSKVDPKIAGRVLQIEDSMAIGFELNNEIKDIKVSQYPRLPTRGGMLRTDEIESNFGVFIYIYIYIYTHIMCSRVYMSFAS